MKVCTHLWESAQFVFVKRTFKYEHHIQHYASDFQKNHLVSPEMSYELLLARGRITTAFNGKQYAKAVGAI